MINKNFKNNFKLLLFLYIVGYIIFNWQDISWVFNYKAIAGVSHSFFNPYSNEGIVEAYFKNQTLPNPTIINSNLQKNTQQKNNILSNIKIEYTDKNNILEIPKINISSNIVFPQTKDINILYNYLDSGVIYYIDSVKPNQAGLITMLGHSAPPGWPKIKYDTVFSELDKLSAGDDIYLNIDNKKYTYKVIETKIINKGQEIENILTDNKNMIVLVSCYPPGKDYKRIAVFGEIQTN